MATLAVFRSSNGNGIKGVLGESRENAANVRNGSGAADARGLKRDVFGIKKRPVKEICTPTSPAAPLAVARRNARERNRVRQVNDGFAALRRRIPDEVADAFENANSNRGPNKKLSKVETLRMAVEYIRNLEALLNVTREDGKENDVGYPSPASSSPHGPSSFERGYFSLHSPPSPPPGDDDDFSDPPTPARPLHALYEDDEAPLTPGSDELLHLRLQDLHAPLPDTVEQQFTVIEPDEVDFCDDLQHPEAEYLDIKYVNPAQLQHLAQGGSCIQLLQGVSSINPHLILAPDQFQCVPGDRQIFMNENSVIIDGNAYFRQQIALKEETPEVDDFNLHEENCENLENTMKW